MMVRASQQAELMGAKYNLHIRRYSTPIFGNDNIKFAKN